VYCLATHPEIQATLRAEIMDFLEQTKGATQQWSEIDKLPYLNNFCREVLRRYCPCESLSPSSSPPPPPTNPPSQPWQPTASPSPT
jgi:cytochrome P450